MYLLLCVLLCIGFILSGCGNQQSTEEPEIVLAAARDLAPGNKDPYYSSVILKTWESLVGISDDGKIKPMLAESWSLTKVRPNGFFI